MIPHSPLSEAVSELSYLLQLSTTILHSLPISVDATSGDLLPCPFNPNHRIPPSSLFSHSLNCPSSLSSVHALHYPCTIHSRPAHSTHNKAPSSEISVSLEKFNRYNVPSNWYFYQNYPGPVTPLIPPPSSFSLPEVLRNECAEFATIGNHASAPVDFVRFLPSEIWAIRSEVEAWGGCLPVAYSFRILRAILNFRGSNLLLLKQWVVASSPRYAVIIDSSIGGHVVLLVNLCFKVICNEAFWSSGSMEDKTEKTDFSSLTNRSFQCPLLVEVMTWLSTQLGVLYGDVQGKIFAVDVLKECVLQSASSASFFPLEQRDSESRDPEKSDGCKEETAKNMVPAEHSKQHDREDVQGEADGVTAIFISQVAAAVAALHERSFVDQNVKYLRYSHLMSAYQRNMEHIHVSTIANEERLKRSDYRPLIEHDGFLWQRSSDRGGDKMKTREELLAEERDYKRRRMSYRGKKLKRNTVEVMRDIIEEYMEELKQAEAVKCGSDSMQEKMKALRSEDLNENMKSSVASVSARKSKLPEHR